MRHAMRSPAHAPPCPSPRTSAQSPRPQKWGPTCARGATQRQWWAAIPAGEAGKHSWWLYINATCQVRQRGKGPASGSCRFAHGRPHPKSGGPRAGTIRPSVRPTNTAGSWPGPAGVGPTNPHGTGCMRQAPPCRAGSAGRQAPSTLRRTARPSAAHPRSTQTCTGHTRSCPRTQPACGSGRRLQAACGQRRGMQLVHNKRPLLHACTGSCRRLAPSRVRLPSQRQRRHSRPSFCRNHLRQGGVGWVGCGWRELGREASQEGAGGFGTWPTGTAPPSRQLAQRAAGGARGGEALLDVRPGQALERVEAEARVLNHHCGAGGAGVGVCNNQASGLSSDVGMGQAGRHAGRQAWGQGSRFQGPAKHSCRWLPASTTGRRAPPAAPSCCAARRHFWAAISSGSPCGRRWDGSPSQSPLPCRQVQAAIIKAMPGSTRAHTVQRSRQQAGRQAGRQAGSRPAGRQAAAQPHGSRCSGAPAAPAGPPPPAAPQTAARAPPPELPPPPPASSCCLERGGGRLGDGAAAGGEQRLQRARRCAGRPARRGAAYCEAWECVHSAPGSDCRSG